MIKANFFLYLYEKSWCKTVFHAEKSSGITLLRIKPTGFNRNYTEISNLLGVNLTRILVFFLYIKQTNEQKSTKTYPT